MTLPSAQFWIAQLKLQFHIEGGWYSEAYRSALQLEQALLPSSFNGNRPACTHIYFLLEKGQFSAFHRIKSDELWHFYSGDPLIIYEIETNGNMTEHLLGNDPAQGQTLFCMIKAGNWFASRVMSGGQYGLVGCTVSPGFDFADFEMAEKEKLSRQYPQHDKLIRELCR